MTEFDNNKLTELVLYILEKTGGVDHYHIYKILYFAEMKHLAIWGSGMVPDRFRAFRYGPVPRKLYSALKDLGEHKTELSAMLADAVEFAGDDASNIILPKRAANPQFLSKSEREILDESISENESLSFAQLLEKSHDAAWQEARNGAKYISPLSMARVMNADDTMIEYIEEQLEIQAALK